MAWNGPPGGGATQDQDSQDGIWKFRVRLKVLLAASSNGLSKILVAFNPMALPACFKILGALPGHIRQMLKGIGPKTHFWIFVRM